MIGDELHRVSWVELDFERQCLEIPYIFLHPKVNIVTVDVYKGSDIAISACPCQLEWDKESINKATQEIQLYLEKRGTKRGKGEGKDISNKELYSSVLINKLKYFIVFFIYYFSKITHKLDQARIRSSISKATEAEETSNTIIVIKII